jgi:hypothetical protein
VSIAADVRTLVVDGPHVWGRHVVRPVGRTLWSSRTLVVWPPGTSHRERLLLRAWGAWPCTGALLAIVLIAVTVDRPALGTACAVLGYALGFVVLGRATRRLRPGVRRVTVTTFPGGTRLEVYGDARLLRGSLESLTVLERALRAGSIRPVDFESVWADVWCALPEGGRASGAVR